MIKTAVQEAAKAVTDTADASARLVEAASKIADERTEQILTKYFDEGQKRQRFIDVNRIPFICDDLHALHAKVDQLMWYMATGVGIVSAVTILMPILLKVYNR